MRRQQRIGLFLDLEGQRVWHGWLARELERLGHHFCLYRSGREATGLPPALRLALWLDPIWFRMKGEHAFDPLKSNTLREQTVELGNSGEPLDLLIDLCPGPAARPPARRIVSLTFNGMRTELGAVSALLDGNGLRIDATSSPDGWQEAARPAIVLRTCLTDCLDSVFSSVVELLIERLDGPYRQSSSRATAEEEKSPVALSSPRPQVSVASIRHVSGLVSAKLARYLKTHSQDPRRWAIATRRKDTQSLIETWPSVTSFTAVPDDGRRYYADPFLFGIDDQIFVFCEEFPFSTGRGLISAARIAPDGTVGDFRPVLERPYHLSYPFIFNFGGQTWMIPESCDRGAVELYRAVEFPHRWELDRTLLEDIRGCDATIIQFGSQYWMTLSTTRWLGSTMDKQRLFQADSPLGPWTEHAIGLVRIDSTISRPAGAPFHRKGKLLRPAQDCSVRYGGSMNLLEVEELSLSAYRETPVATVRVETPLEVLGTHTYSAFREFEAVDIWGQVTAVRSVQLKCTPLETHSRTPIEAPTRSS